VVVVGGAGGVVWAKLNVEPADSSAVAKMRVESLM
jgi:hypothetical protein